MMKTPRERYHSNSQYKALVDTMVAHIYACHYTPSELREASILASIIYEEQQIRHVRFIPPEIETALDILHDFTKKVDD